MGNKALRHFAHHQNDNACFKKIQKIKSFDEVMNTLIGIN